MAKSTAMAQWRVNTVTVITASASMGLASRDMGEGAVERDISCIFIILDNKGYKDDLFVLVLCC